MIISLFGGGGHPRVGTSDGRILETLPDDERIREIPADAAQERLRVQARAEIPDRHLEVRGGIGPVGYFLL